MRDAGIPVIAYPDGFGPLKAQLTHRKLLIVGGGPNSNTPATGMAFLNVGTEYSAVWSDFSWRFRGPPCVDLMNAWIEQKNRVIGQISPSNLNAFAGRNTPIHRVAPGEMDAWLQKTMAIPQGGNVYNSIRIVPHRGLIDQNIKTIGIAAIKTAARRIRMVSPYTTDAETLQALKDAGRRLGPGKVTLLLPANNDMKETKLGSRTWYAELLGSNIQVRHSTKPMLHAKLKIFDDLVEGGSSNLDARSLWNNDELVGSVNDRAMADLLEQRVFQDPKDIIVDQALVAKYRSDTKNWALSVVYRDAFRQL